MFAKPLEPSEQSEVAQWLRPAEAPLFWGQQVADQRHGLETARKIAARFPGDVELIRAGLLHDVGKREARLSAVGRTFATLAGLAKLPLTTRFRLYRDHGPVGATALAALDAEDLVIAFASLHPGGPPPGMAADRWQVLLDADDD